jgi:hypothetical protein
MAFFNNIVVLHFGTGFQVFLKCRPIGRVNDNMMVTNYIT